MPEPSFSVFLTRDAEDDLDAILEYVSENGSPDEAVRMLQKIGARIDSLKAFPLRGTVPKELEAMGDHDHRQVVVFPFRLVYRVLDNSVFVMLVADGRRDMQALLRRRLLGR